MALTVGQFGATLKRAVDAIKEQCTTENEAIVARLDQIEAKLDAWTSTIYHIKELLDSAMGTEQIAANQEQEQEQEETNSGKVPALPLEEGELDTISF